MPRAGRRRAGGIPLRREGGLCREEVRRIRGVWVLFIFLERSPATSCQGASRRDRLPDVENYLGRLEECNQSISRSKLSRTKKEEYVPAPSTPTPNYLPPYNHHHLPPQRPVYRPQLTPSPPPNLTPITPLPPHHHSFLNTSALASTSLSLTFCRLASSSVARCVSFRCSANLLARSPPLPVFALACCARA